MLRILKGTLVLFALISGVPTTAGDTKGLPYPTPITSARGADPEFVPGKLPLDGEGDRPVEVPEWAVGGSKQKQGYVASFGSFSLSRTKSEGMVFLEDKFPDPYFFEHGKLTYVREYTDKKTKVSGSLYKMVASNKEVYYFLFGNKDICLVDDVIRRFLFVYTSDGCVRWAGKVFYGVSRQ